MDPGGVWSHSRDLSVHGSRLISVQHLLYTLLYSELREETGTCTTKDIRAMANKKTFVIPREAETFPRTCIQPVAAGEEPEEGQHLSVLQNGFFFLEEDEKNARLKAPSRST